MKIAIHNNNSDFSSKWIEYCQSSDLDYKIVNSYDNDIIDQVDDCDAFMWHFHQTDPKDTLFAKQLIFSLQQAGKKVFPDFHTAWHFDDKVGQKYLLEALDMPLVPSYVFYDKRRALKWIDETTFPKVFKLRRGAGSAHVKLVNSKSEAKKLVKTAFSRGFSQYDKMANLKERWYKYKHGKGTFFNVLKGIVRLGKTTEFARMAGNEKGYAYFQDFIPNNDSDIRIIVIDGKAFGIRRLVREGDFRASGSGNVVYEKHHFDEQTIRLSFELAEKMNSQCLAIDYVYRDDRPLIVEVSYGFINKVFHSCEGYWDRDLNWHTESFEAQEWIVKSLLA